MERSTDVEPSTRRRAFFLYAGVGSLLVLLLIGNLAYSMFLHEIWGSEWSPVVDELVASLGMCMFFAQWALHAIWTVFGRMRLVWRGLASIGVALLIITSIFVPAFFDRFTGTMITGSDDTEMWRQVLKSVLWPHLVILGLQFPLWILRWGWGWQVCSVKSDPNPEKSGQLSIGGILLATAVVGAAIGCVRLAAAVVHVPVSAMMLSTVIMSGVAAGMSLATLVPAVFATLYARRLRLALTLQYAFFGFVLLSCFAFVWILEGAWPDPDDALILAVSFVAMPVMLHAPLLWVRSRGYRLVRVKKSLTPEPPAVSRSCAQ